MNSPKYVLPRDNTYLQSERDVRGTCAHTREPAYSELFNLGPNVPKKLTEWQLYTLEAVLCWCRLKLDRGEEIEFTHQQLLDTIGLRHPKFALCPNRTFATLQVPKFISWADKNHKAELLGLLIRTRVGNNTGARTASSYRLSPVMSRMMLPDQDCPEPVPNQRPAEAAQGPGGPPNRPGPPECNDEPPEAARDPRELARSEWAKREAALAALTVDDE